MDDHVLRDLILERIDAALKRVCDPDKVVDCLDAALQQACNPEKPVKEGPPLTEGSGDSEEPADNDVNKAIAPEAKSEVQLEVKPAEEQPKLDGSAQHINLVVREVTGKHTIHFRMKTNTSFRKLMNAYCDKMSVDPSTIAFIFDGRRLQTQHTPAELKMEEGDMIDAFVHLMGG
ncbi:hypothetical protein M758_6G171400 [Ceratodon purpureus]|uniref:Ubiquitin-like domain-containing protein n=1 Tax=Ceratodon purpureus TaxID=3225 RepID=A0A8T0HGY6_CERPU|nr:hypothetical protein KC19_6G178500 [Ceratodon purpureus]KAG0614370.1 hypothetical protein M758_6G171400 [Ceratodon purpureus]